MDRTPPDKTGNKAAKRDAESREARLKAALKANIARRKAQARARAADGDVDDTGNGQE